MLVSNLGLSHLIQLSVPVLTAIYPPCIVLVVLSFTLRWWGNGTRVVGPVMLISLLFGLIDGLKASALASLLPDWSLALPLNEQGWPGCRPRCVPCCWRPSGIACRGVHRWRLSARARPECKTGLPAGFCSGNNEQGALGRLVVFTPASPVWR